MLARIWLALALLVSAAQAETLNGIALTPFSEDPSHGMTFLGMVDEIAATGSPYLSLVVQWAQADVTATEIKPHSKETQNDETIRAIIRRAKAKGMKVMLFPIIWVEKRATGEWRGTLKPANEVIWWAAYRNFIFHYAEMAAAEKVDIYSVGSELASLEDREPKWRALIAEVRRRFTGKLVYSANWDHYANVPFWDAVDLVGMTAYHRLAETNQPTDDQLVASWTRIRDELLNWQKKINRPLLFTELGYPSMDGAAQKPWDYTVTEPIDLDEQTRCFAAFMKVWRGQPALGGVFFWNWWGLGGPEDGSYTPRGKPALELIKAWLKDGGAASN